jgi:hypothetical protein
MPVPEPIVALALLLLHAPPVVPLKSVVWLPTQTAAVPVMTAGTGLTVTTVVDMQPVPSMYVIIDVPPETPVTTPVEEPIAALPLLLLQVPPDEVLLRVVVSPAQTTVVPDIVAGNGFTVTVVTMMQPVPRVYVIAAVPNEAPVATPDDEPIVTFALLLLHMPPVTALLRLVVEPRQTDVGPVIPAGKGLTVNTIIAWQPVLSIYVILAVPEVTPVTTPVVDPIVAFPLLLLHVPPEVVLLRLEVSPMQTCGVPVIAAGSEFIVTAAVASVPQPVLYIITVVPELTLVNIPEEVPMVATEVLLLVQVPPAAELLNVVDKPRQRLKVPVMLAGAATTVTVMVVVLPVIYDMVAVPAATPVSSPVVRSIVALDVLLLLQVPPEVASLNVTVLPSQTSVGPVIWLNIFPGSIPSSTNKPSTFRYFPQ